MDHTNWQVNQAYGSTLGPAGSSTAPSTTSHQDKKTTPVPKAEASTEGTKTAERTKTAEGKKPAPKPDASAARKKAIEGKSTAAVGKKPMEEKNWQEEAKVAKEEAFVWRHFQF